MLAEKVLLRMVRCSCEKKIARDGTWLLRTAIIDFFFTFHTVDCMYTYCTVLKTTVHVIVYSTLARQDTLVKLHVLWQSLASMRSKLSRV